MRNFQILIVSAVKKSINNVCKLLYLLEDKITYTRTGASHLDATRINKFIARQIKIPNFATDRP